jgi:2-haloacid dehalogenase
MTPEEREQRMASVDGVPVDTLLFDTMGTVVDVEGTIREQLGAILARYGRADAERVAGLWDRHIRTAMDEINRGDGSWRSHRSLRQAALEMLIDTNDLPTLDEAERDALVSTINTLKAWPDSPSALTSLSKIAKVVAFSNADLAELAELSRNADLRWHAVISAELAHAYKPHPSIYQTALDLLKLDPRRTLVVAAHPWDLRAAARAGMLTAYIGRPYSEKPTGQDRFTITATDLVDLETQLDAGRD